jgi:DNA replication protein DnaC
MDESEILAQANDTILARRRDSQSSADSVSPIAGTVSRLLEKLDQMPDESQAMAEAQEQRNRDLETARRREDWGKLIRRIGRRYKNSTLENFEAPTGPQTLALEAARAYAAKMPEHVKSGRGVFLYGPPGTGKDHLATAMLRLAVLEHGMKVEWTDGADFFGAMRDNIGSDGSEAAILSRWRTPDLLAISDPVPPRGDVDSAYQLSMLFRVIDRRYRDLKPTLVTLNAADRGEAEKRLSPNIIDRLAHGALAIHCNWKSYRR